MATEKEPDLCKNFIFLAESFKGGLLLLIKHLPEQNWKSGNISSARLNLIEKIINAYFKLFQKKLEKESTISFKRIYSHFSIFIENYISIIAYYTIIDEKNQLSTLYEAARFFLWGKGRGTFEKTISAGENNNSYESKISLSEKPIKSISEQLLPGNLDRNPWFNFLPEWQKNIIRSEKLWSKNQEEIVYSIPSSLRNIPGLANASFHEMKTDEKQILSYFRHATQLPIDLLEKKEAEDEQFRLTCLNVATQIKESLDRKIQDKTRSTAEIIILIQSLVSPGKAASFKAKFISTSSDNDTKIYDFKEKAIRLFQHALASPEKKLDNEIKKIFFDEEKCKKNLLYRDLLKEWGLNIQHNNIYQDKLIRLTLLSTNHPLNSLRHFEVYQPQIEGNKKNTALLLGAVARYLKPQIRKNLKINEINSWPQWEDYLNKYNTDDEFNIKLSELIKILELCEKEKKISVNYEQSIIKLIKKLLASEVADFDENILKLMHALNALLSIPSGQGVLRSDKRHKPQLRSAAEIMIINCLNGAAWIACKSGKDRTGGASIAADAMAIYYEQNKKFPLYHDNELNRKKYLEIFQKLYESGYHQYLASVNAPGAEGLINPVSFFPGDFSIDADLALLGTRLARLNKPKVISAKKEKFDDRILKSNLQNIIDKTINTALVTNSTLINWRGSWEKCSINNKSVEGLNDETLCTLIDTEILTQIEGEDLKKYYKALILYSFHHGGFPDVFSKTVSSMDSANEYLAKKNVRQINFSYSKDRKGIQIEEINSYKEKNNTEDVSLSDEYYCETQSCILLKLNEAKNGAYNLAVSIESARVDCVDELKFLFYKKSNLLEAFILYLQSLLVAIKHYFDKLIKKPGPVLNEEWLRNTSLFRKSNVSENERENNQQNRVLSY